MYSTTTAWALEEAHRARVEEDAARPVKRLTRYLGETGQEVAAEVARGACWMAGALLVLKISGRL